MAVLCSSRDVHSLTPLKCDSLRLLRFSTLLYSVRNCGVLLNRGGVKFKFRYDVFIKLYVMVNRRANKERKNPNEIVNKNVKLWIANQRLQNEHTIWIKSHKQDLWPQIKAERETKCSQTLIVYSLSIDVLPHSAADSVGYFHKTHNPLGNPYLGVLYRKFYDVLLNFAQ